MVKQRAHLAGLRILGLRILIFEVVAVSLRQPEISYFAAADKGRNAQTQQGYKHNDCPAEPRARSMKLDGRHGSQMVREGQKR